VGMTDYNLVQYVDHVDIVPTNNKIKKQMFINGQWQEQIFIQCDWSKALETWLWEKYPNKGYLKDWWLTSKRVTMNDKVYVHWKLCE
jgi:hypothetical protein